MILIFISGYKVESEAYGCSYKGCDWSTGVQGTDWDYYSTTNGNCTYCMNECDKDKTCEGVECGGSHCSWWKMENVMKLMSTLFQATEKIKCVSRNQTSEVKKNLLSFI